MANNCPPALAIPTQSRSCSNFVTFVGGASSPLPASLQTHVETTKCCDDTTGDGVGDTTFFKTFVTDGTGTVTSQTVVDSGGMPYTPVSEVPCAIQQDLEAVEACFQTIGDPSMRYTRVTFVDTTNGEVDGVIWIDDATGLAVSPPDATLIEPSNDDCQPEAPLGLITDAANL